MRTEAEARTPSDLAVPLSVTCLLGLCLEPRTVGPEGKQESRQSNPLVSRGSGQLPWSFDRSGVLFFTDRLSNTKPTDNPLCWAGVALLLSALGAGSAGVCTCQMSTCPTQTGPWRGSRPLTPVPRASARFSACPGHPWVSTLPWNR